MTTTSKMSSGSLDVTILGTKNVDRDIAGKMEKAGSMMKKASGGLQKASSMADKMGVKSDALSKAADMAGKADDMMDQASGLMGGDDEGGAGGLFGKVFGMSGGNQFTVYEIRVKFGEYDWTIQRRYSQFDSLHQLLSELYPSEMKSVAAFPSKNRLKRMDPQVIKDRQASLQQWVYSLLKSQIGQCYLVMRFLQAEHWAHPCVVEGQLSGFLSKKGEMVKSMKNRWFVLQDHLYYSESRHDPVPIGFIKLEKGVEAEKAPSNEGENSFHIITPGRVWLLVASSFGERDSWLEAVMRNIKEVDHMSKSVQFTILSESELARRIKEENEHGEGAISPAPMMSPKLEAKALHDSLPLATSLPTNLKPSDNKDDDADSDNESIRLEDIVTDLFHKYDVQDQGKIPISKVDEALREYGYSFPADVLMSLHRAVDFDHNNVLNLGEFSAMIFLLDALKNDFDAVDTGSSGKISVSDLDLSLSRRNYRFSPAQVLLMHKYVDRDNSKSLSFDEYVDLVFYLQYLHKLFNTADEDGSGSISAPELNSFLVELGLRPTPDVLKRIMQDAEADQDTNTLSFEQFVNVIFLVQFGNVPSLLMKEYESELNAIRKAREDATTMAAPKLRQLLWDRRETEDKLAMEQKIKAEQEEASRKQLRERLEKAAQETKDMLMKGAEFNKHGRSGRPHKCRVWCSNDFRRLYWKSDDKFLVMKNIIDIRIGLKTDVFLRAKKDGSAKENLSFSLVTATRTLDLEAASEIDRAKWVRGLRWAINNFAMDDANEKSSSETATSSQDMVSNEMMPRAASMGDNRREQLRQVFRQFDREDTGNIKLRDLGMILESAGFKFDPNVVKSLLMEVDYNRDGKLTLTEFVDLVAYITQLKMNFDGHDANGDEKITRDELKEVLDTLGFKFGQVRLNDIFRMFDSDGSKGIEFEEYVGLVYFIKYLRKLFDQADKDHSGTLQGKELADLLKKMKLELPKELLEEFLEDTKKSENNMSFENFVDYIMILEFGGLLDPKVLRLPTPPTV